MFSKNAWQEEPCSTSIMHGSSAIMATLSVLAWYENIWSWRSHPLLCNSLAVCHNLQRLQTQHCGAACRTRCWWRPHAVHKKREAKQRNDVPSRGTAAGYAVGCTQPTVGLRDHCGNRATLIRGDMLCQQGPCCHQTATQLS